MAKIIQETGDRRSCCPCSEWNRVGLLGTLATLVFKAIAAAHRPDRSALPRAYPRSLGVTGWGCLAPLAAACASPIPTTPGLPLYIHLCESMPAADAYDWGKAAAAVNAELGDALRVGNGPIPADATCSFVDVCPSEVETTEIAGACVTLVRYPVGDTAEAKQVLWLLAAQGGS